jgi:nucleotide-binding universal stress UspA family protein
VAGRSRSCAIPGLVAADEQAAELIGSQDDEREGGDGGDLCGGQCGGPEDAVQGGHVYQHRGEREREGRYKCGRNETEQFRSRGGTIWQDRVAPRIVVGVDGSLTSDTARRWAVGQAQLTGGTVDAVIAWHCPPPIVGFGMVPIGAYDSSPFRELADKTVAAAISRAGTARDVTVHAVVQEGNVAHVLLTVAEGADLLVVGSRGHGGFAGLLLGSVSQHSVHHAPCPVVVIRDSEHD